MQVTETPLTGLLILEPKVFRDERGVFFESFNQRSFDIAIGHHIEFMQDNHSLSARGVLRGLHYQLPPHAQGKLVRLALEDDTEFLYKTTDFYAKECERVIAWNDPSIGIAWPDIGVAPLLASKDREAPTLSKADLES
jgi:dTDP-4-dehydrorhamnose 3,5-epimerase